MNNVVVTMNSVELSMNDTDCPKKEQCFSGTPCNAKDEPSSSSEEESSPANKPSGGRPPGPGDSPSPTIWTPLNGPKEENEGSGNTASQTTTDVDEVVDEVTSKFFCGKSWGELIAKCEKAKPCPSGTNAECEGGQSCFANTPCGATAAPPEEEEEVMDTVGIFNFAAMVKEIPPFCKDGKTMSRNVGYWQSWSI